MTVSNNAKAGDKHVGGGEEVMKMMMMMMKNPADKIH